MRLVKLAAVACVLAVLGLGAVSVAAWGSSNEAVFFESPYDLLKAGSVTRSQTLAQLQSLGVHALRVVLYWRDVAPSPNHKHAPSFNQADPSKYHWGSYDKLIDAATAKHFQVLLTVSGPVPHWASACGCDQYTSPNTSDFTLFMEAVGRRYGRRVKLFAIWNEPNQPGFLRPQYVHGTLLSATIYRRLFLAGYAGLRASGNFSGMRVLMGDTSATGVQSQHIPPPLAFLRGVLCLNSNYKPIGHCAQLPAAGWAQHPYAGSHPLAAPPTDDVTISTLGRLVTALDRAAAAGAIRRALPVYLTEFGVESYPNHIVGVSLQAQAEYDAIAEKLAWTNPRVASFSQYLMRDDGPRTSGKGTSGGFQSGLETSTGTQKPAYAGFRLPLVVTQSGGGVSLWGLVLPTHRTTRVVVQYSANGGASWHQLEVEHTNSSGAWSGSGRFTRHRMWRVLWTAPGGAIFTGAPTRAYTASGNLEY